MPPGGDASAQLAGNATDRSAHQRLAASIFDQVMWSFRCAFFRDCRDTSRWDTQCEIAEGLGANVNAIEECIHGGAAFARLAGDYQDADKMRIEGSPSFVLNEGAVARAAVSGRLSVAGFDGDDSAIARRSCLEKAPAYRCIEKMSTIRL